MASMSFVANGDIFPSRFVKLLTADDSVTQCGANDPIIGVSQKFPRYTPIDSALQQAAQAGQALLVYIGGADMAQGDLIEVGTGGLTVGDQVSSDANGKGVTMATTSASKQYIGGIALETRAAGEFCRILIRPAAVTNN